MIQHHDDITTITFNNIEEQPNYKRRLKDFGTPTLFQSSTPQLTSKEISTNEKNQPTKFTDDDNPIKSFQKRLNNPVTPQLKSNSTTFQQQSIRVRGRGSYSRYGGGRRGGRRSGQTQSQRYSAIQDKEQRGIGRGIQPIPRYSTITDNGPQSTTTLDTQKDITIDSDSE